MRPDYTLQELEDKFKEGWTPKKKNQTYECGTCAAVGLYLDGTLNDEDFDSDNAFERDDKFLKSRLAEEFMTPEDFWIPPSQRVNWL